MTHARRKNVGLWADRLAPKCDNPREVAFAAEWEMENERIGGSGMVFSRLLYDHGGSETLDTSAVEVDRDRIVAATIIQWLGSNVGFSFLENALRACGYEITREKAGRRT